MWCLISSKDPTDGYRDGLLHMLKYSNYWEEFVDPEYRQLMPLVKSMAALIKEDYHWVKEEKYKHLEYLHDALQRLILGFVLENKEASFMDSVNTGRQNRSSWHRYQYIGGAPPPCLFR